MYRVLGTITTRPVQGFGKDVPARNPSVSRSPSDYSPGGMTASLVVLSCGPGFRFVILRSAQRTGS